MILIFTDISHMYAENICVTVFFFFRCALQNVYREWQAEEQLLDGGGTIYWCA